MKPTAWNKGKKWSDEIKQKISVSLKGKTPWNKGKVGLMPPVWNKGKTLTEEHKAKISQSRKGIAPWNKGRAWPDETKEKLRQAALKRYEQPKTVDGGQASQN